jgi:hypothetical protein
VSKTKTVQGSEMDKVLMVKPEARNSAVFSLVRCLSSEGEEADLIGLHPLYD